MTRTEILTAYKEGRLTADEVREKLRMASGDITAGYPLTEGQKGLWLLHKLYPGMSTYHVPVCFRLNRAHAGRLRQAYKHALDRHPVLSTVIRERQGEPYQVMLPDLPVDFRTEELPERNEQEGYDYLERCLEEPFPLERGPLVRFHLLQLKDGVQLAQLTVHHLIFDGSSCLPFMECFLEAYRTLTEEGGLPAGKTGMDYRRYVDWERSMSGSTEGEEHRAYWKRQLAGDLPALELPADHTRAAVRPGSRGQYVVMPLGHVLSSLVKEGARLLGVNPSAMLLCTYMTLLYRYTGQRELIVGMPASMRAVSGLEAMVGYGVNILPIRCRLSPDESFTALVKELQLTIADALDHSAYPFTAMVRDLQLSRTEAGTPVVQSTFAFQNYLHGGALSGLEQQYEDVLSLKFIDDIRQPGDMELELEVFERDEEYHLCWKFNAQLFDRSTIERIHTHFAVLLQEVIQEPRAAVNTVHLMPPDEREAVLVTWNRTDADYPKDRCLHELVEAQAMLTPEDVAVEFAEQKLNYRELDQRSTRLAVQLQLLGARPDGLIGVCVERSPEMPVILLAILKAGSAYVPLDPEFPEERLAYMLEDSGVSVVVTHSRLAGRLPVLTGNVRKLLLLDREEAQPLPDHAALIREVQPGHLAYVLYTSGSTGKPKGVMVSHQSLVNLLWSVAEVPGFEPGGRLLALSTYCFDIAGVELFLPLLRGGTCCICEADTVKDVDRLKLEIGKRKPTYMQATPVTWSLLFHSGWNPGPGLTAVCTGEALPESVRKQFTARGMKAWNLFGPTETTIYSTAQFIESGGPITIGRPVANTRVYIVDSCLNPLPAGIPGELCIAGDGVARGYWNKPELTAEKFTANPFEAKGRLYRTGDLARWRPDGSIECLGRLDHQVKIRGFRIELSEIEARLSSHPGIEEAVAVVRQMEAVKQLIAYYTPAKDLALPDSRTLRTYLRTSLPGYMVPSVLVPLDALPLTASGKIDRKKLAGYDPLQTYAARASLSRTDMEQQLAAIWEEVLQQPAVGVEEGFFEAGGDSYLAVLAANRIQEHFKRDFTVTDLIAYGTIKDIASRLLPSAEASEDEEQGFRAVHKIASEPERNTQTPEALAANPGPEDEDTMAVVGIACQFPGARDHRAFWELLQGGEEGLRRSGKVQQRADGAHFVPLRGELEGRDLFDPAFFQLSRRDAQWMDPQFRLLLQLAWTAVEDAGYTPDQIPDTGVFVSASNSLYPAYLPGFNKDSASAWTDSEGYVSWVLAQSGTIPAMISNKLGLNGPSFFVHANCSSSLVGIYSAFQSLRAGDIRYALVGGATILPHIQEGYWYEKGLNFAADGRCKAFDAAADGMVGGEGAAVLLLKRTSDALRDGDSVYAIIRGIGVSNDGAEKAGFYAPGAKGQAAAIRKALEQAKVHPETIRYVEAHGTGTQLGDPVEVAALSEAYGQFTSKRQYCGIGSVKSNVGHLDTAAGLAGCIKAALSLHHGEVPATLHADHPTPAVDWARSPFFVANQPLSLPRNDDHPNRIGVSAFGLGGTNVHLILEQAPACREALGQGEDEGGPVLIPLSARTDERLEAYIGDWLEYLDSVEQTTGSTHLKLRDLAYTLQTGREAMSARAAFIVSSIGELAGRLRRFKEGQREIGDVIIGETGPAAAAKSALKLYEQDEDHREMIRSWFAKGKLHKLAELWVQGFPLDWTMLYNDGLLAGRLTPQRIHLPTYPFAREAFALRTLSDRSGRGSTQYLTSAGTAERQAASGQAVLHPLLHSNTSDFTEQRYSSEWAGNEPFLADHVVRGNRILPGVAHLEMAASAALMAMGQSADAPTLTLYNVSWIRPVTAAATPVLVHIGMTPGTGEDIAYRIYSSQADTAEQLVFSQGSARLSVNEPQPRLDLEALRKACVRKVWTSTSCYEFFARLGVSYGPAFQAIGAVYAGEGQAVAALALPSWPEAGSTYLLHPALLDAAVQAMIGLRGQEEQTGTAQELTIPFALEELQMWSRCPSDIWVWVREADEGSSGPAQRVSVDLCDAEGKVCVRLKGLASRVLPANSPPADTGTAPVPEEAGGLPPGLHRLAAVWNPVAASPSSPAVQHPESSARTVMIGLTEEQQLAVRGLYPDAFLLRIPPSASAAQVQEALASAGTLQHIIWTAAAAPGCTVTSDVLVESQQQGVIQVFRLVQAAIALGLGGRPLAWTFITGRAVAVHPSEQPDPAHAGVHGLAGSLAKEFPDWTVKVLDMEADGSWPGPEMFTLPEGSPGELTAYRGGEWFRKSLIPVGPLPVKPSAYRHGGVYVVIGGAGGIGEAWTEYMLRTYQAKVFWIGRRPRDRELDARLTRLSALGPAPEYVRADATDRAALEHAVKEIRLRAGRIHGVIHAAIELHDQSLALMEEPRLIRVLAAKTDVCVRLAQVLEPVAASLDFVLFFSSLSAFAKAPGQSGYAAGCTFKDAFAEALAQAWPCTVKIMHWGYWGSVGIVASQEQKARMSAAGFGSIEPEEAMEALECLLAGPLPQLALSRTVRPGVWKELCSAERLTVYPRQGDARTRTGRRLSAEGLPRRPDRPLRQERIRDIDALLTALLYAQMQSLGWFREQMMNASPPKPPKGGPAILDRYDRWLTETVAVLKRAGYLAEVNGQLEPRAQREAALPELWQEWERNKQLWLEDDDLKAMVIFVEDTVRALPQVLTGQVPATDILFPNSSLERVEGLYKNNAPADYYNEVLGTVLTAHVKERLEQDPGCRLRILEIGAGTGGTTAVTLRELEPYRRNIEEYCYTDVSRAFLLHGENMFGPHYPFLTYRLLNVEAPTAGQGLPSGQFDIVIAANVLHATRLIRQTLRHTKALLRPDGLLLLNEMCANTLAAHLIFGLVDGWWRYDDEALRLPGSPVLPSQTWLKVLAEQGFHSAFLPAPEAADWGQQIIAAFSDGIVREPLNVTVSKQAEDPQVLMDRTAARTPLEASPVPPVPVNPVLADDTLRGQCSLYLRNLVAEALRTEVREIDATEPLERYGIDSILVVQLTNKLNLVFDRIPSTVFFEYQTLDGVARYLISKHRERLKTLLEIPEEVKPGSAISRQENTEANVTPPSRRFVLRSDLSITDSASEPLSAGAAPDAPAVKDPAGRPEIAIIGLAGRYPGARDVHEFWELLKSGRSAITEIPPERWDWESYYNAKRGVPGTMYSKWGGFISDFDTFDPLFFRISPAEAERIDPQERLFLQTAYEAIEDAGYTPANLSESRKVAVFVGVMNASYPTGAAHYSVANRVSYTLDLQGPSLAVDSACSGSLAAIHLALDSLYSGTSDCAIAGGVNLIYDPKHYVTLSELGMLSSGRECRAFGEGADGFVDGEGVGAILLKPLAQAVKDGDHIYGVIKGSMLNAGGKTNGYTVPNPNAQYRLVGDALKQADIDARSISYIEAHGTGTALGDPLEVSALTRAFGEHTADKQFCAIGSVKSNIGHGESAAGIAGVTKVLLQMKHGMLAPSLHAGVENCEIRFAETPFALQQQAEPWNRPVVETVQGTTRYPRRAGISSFGAGGANAHLIIEEYEATDAATAPYDWQPGEPVALVFSAKQPQRLRELAQQWHKVLAQGRYSEQDLPGIVYTLQTGREAMEERLGMVCRSLKELEHKLALFLSGVGPSAEVYTGQVRPNKDMTEALMQDTGMQEVIAGWLSDRRYDKLLPLWVKGFPLDWTSLYRDRLPRRISLPTYPFARLRFWLEQPVPAASASMLPAEAKEPVAPVPAAQPVLVNQHEPQAPETTNFFPAWQEAPLPAASIQRGADGGTVVILHDEGAAILAERLQEYMKYAASGSSLVRICLEPVRNAGGYGSGQDIYAYAQELQQAGPVSRIYYLYSGQAMMTGLGGIEEVRRLGDSESGELQLLRLIRYLKQQPLLRERSDLYLITCNQTVLADGPPNPDGAGIAGLGYALAQGDYRYAVRNIDISAEDLSTADTVDRLLRQLEQEPPSDRGERIKLHLGVRYRQVFLPLHDNGDPGAGTGFRRQGVYVIAGGSGTVGQRVTHYLMERYDARVIWIGRTPAGSPELQVKLAGFSSFPEKPYYVQADVTNAAELNEAVSQLKLRFPQIHGAMFAGVVTQPNDYAGHTGEEEFLRVFRVKSRGTAQFYAAFSQEPLDFLCYFSSAQAFPFSGAAGLSAYAAGITSADTLAEYIHCLQTAEGGGYPVGVINWGFWQATPGLAAMGGHVGALEDETACLALDRFTGWLREGRIRQSVCLQVKEPVRRLMNLHPSEAVILLEPEHHGIAQLPVAEPDKAELEQLVQRFDTSAADRWIAELLFIQLRSMGILSAAGPAQTLPAMRQAAAILPKYDRWLREACALLEENHLVHGDAGAYRGQSVLTEEQVWPEWERAKTGFLGNADWAAKMKVADACLRQLPAVLRGETAATSIIFPEAAVGFVEGIYQNNGLTDYFNRIMADQAAAYVRQRVEADPLAKVRIIEIGAGTGGTSAAMFRRLAPWAQQVEYVYTDISRAFLLFAEERYGRDNPYVSFRLWDIAKPGEVQGIEAGGFDLVIATNVLHATGNIRQTLQHAKAALRAGGWLLLHEMTAKAALATVTFGLLDGWWLYEDEPLRIPGSPLLSLETWQNVMAREGFRNISLPAVAAQALGLQVIGAQSNGVIRVAAASSPGGMKAKATENRAASRQAGALPQAEPDHPARRTILRALSVSLKLEEEEIDPHTAFADYGVDSIIGTAFITRLGQELGFPLNSALLFDYATVDKLDGYLRRTYPQAGEQNGSGSTEILPGQRTTGETALGAVLDSLSACLKIPREDLDIRIAFADYGVDSILGAALMKEINARLGLSLGSALLFEYATAERLAAYIAGHCTITVKSNTEASEEAWLAMLEHRFFEEGLPEEELLELAGISGGENHHG